MWIVPEKEIAGLMTRDAAFDAVEKVFAAMAADDAYNFPSCAKRSAMRMRFMASKAGSTGRARRLG